MNGTMASLSWAFVLVTLAYLSVLSHSPVTFVASTLTANRRQLFDRVSVPTTTSIHGPADPHIAWRMISGSISFATAKPNGAARIDTRVSLTSLLQRLAVRRCATSVNA